MSKKILITGAAVEIGAEIARELCEGNELILHYYQSQKEADELASELSGRARSIHLFQADLTNEAGCRELAQFCSDTFSSLDVLINNSGGLLKRESVGELTWKTIVDTFAVNAYSTMFLTSELKAALSKGDQPTVINISSIAMRHGAPSATAYGASKAAVDSFTRGAAKELGPDIRVNAVAPGIIDTRFHTKVSTSEQMETWREATPLKKHGVPKDVALAVNFLINNAFMTGETIDLNGGLLMR